LATHFYPLTVASVRRETPVCVSVSFEIPEALKEAFAYSPGQHLTIRKIINGEETRRNYSLCSSPLDKEWRIAVKKVDGGLFSKYANEELKPGDVIDVMPPLGKFYTPLIETNKKHYVAFAGGSGITPVISIIITTLRTESHSSFTLFYANRDHNSIIFKELLEELKDKYLGRFNVHHVFSREQTDTVLNSGHIDEQKCELIFSKVLPLESVDDIFICGPAGMIETVRDFLLEKGFDKQKIHFELFGAGKAAHQRNAPQKQDTVASALVEIKLDGRTSSFNLPSNGLTILDAALQTGADLPYACKGGVCTTCRAKLLEGKVTMDANYGLDETEIKNGFILTCQSHPVTAKVVVDFDQK
jgi:ring-1,2-phenylacetyl-CoA epoxidase subunit PaaE